MKKNVFILCLLAVALTSCDPMFDISYKLVNDSGHAVTFISVVQPGFGMTILTASPLKKPQTPLSIVCKDWEQQVLKKQKGICFRTSMAKP